MQVSEDEPTARAGRGDRELKRGVADQALNLQVLKNVLGKRGDDGPAADHRRRDPAHRRRAFVSRLRKRSRRGSQTPDLRAPSSKAAERQQPYVQRSPSSRHSRLLGGQVRLLPKKMFAPEDWRATFYSALGAKSGLLTRLR